MSENQSDLRQAVEGRVDRVLFSNEENGWCVVRLETEANGQVTAIGPLLGVRPGDTLRLGGRWINHRKYGEQFEAESYVQVAPSTREGLRRFLGAGKIRGIGAKRAKQIVDEFGLETIEILDNNPDRLLKIRGIGPATIRGIRESWDQHRGIQQIMVFLTGHGVAPGIAVKAFQRYGPAAVDAVRANPFRLAEDIFGVGFLTADRIARHLGIPAEAPERLEAGLLHSLNEAAGQGHVFLPEDELLETASALLGVDGRILPAALADLATARKVVCRVRTGSDAAVYLPRLVEAEETVADRLSDLLRSPDSGRQVIVQTALAWYQGRAGIQLAPNQREALVTAFKRKAVVVTGGPGTGKTTLIRGLVEILGRKNVAIELAAPTGRAAKRLSEAAGLGARTIHRLLEFDPKTRSFSRDSVRPIAAEYIVVDEVSMLDIELAAALLLAVPPTSHLVLVGDADQIPSVGPGNVLADLIESQSMPVVRLETIFRQARKSRIVANAHRVNQGTLPRIDNEESGDFFFAARDEPAEVADLVIDFAVRRIPDRYGFDPIKDIQVLAPMHRGELGVIQLNERLQAELTPPSRELVVGWRRFRTGDKIMQVRNNYDLDIFNGDMGRIESINFRDRELVVDFDGRPVDIPADAVEDLVPAYACTIHKSQGSEYPAVVIVLHHQHHVMLQRNLLYTAITRGRKLVVVVGSKRALGRAVFNATVRTRHTLLAERLREAATAPATSP
ncbi:MAG: ATP-dependent RecD-like DNA helicase [Holophagae bacterium]|jgi:exodeoxyribonuclease V alpha subunit